MNALASRRMRKLIKPDLAKPLLVALVPGKLMQHAQQQENGAMKDQKLSWLSFASEQRNHGEEEAQKLEAYP